MKNRDYNDATISKYAQSNPSELVAEATVYRISNGIGSLNNLGLGDLERIINQWLRQ